MFSKLKSATASRAVRLTGSVATMSRKDPAGSDGGSSCALALCLAILGGMKGALPLTCEGADCCGSDAEPVF